MRILGVDLPTAAAAGGAPAGTLVLLDDQGRAVDGRPVASLPEVAALVGQLSGDEPFLLGVNVPIVVPQGSQRARPVENVIRRRLGVRLSPGGRAALSGTSQGIVGEALMAGLAVAGQPPLPYPDRDRRRSGLLETYPELILKALLWETSALAEHGKDEEREAILKAFSAPAYRAQRLPGRAGWTDQVVALDLLLRSLATVDDFDLSAVREQVNGAASAEDAERAAGLLDATLIASLARRYLESPEGCLFLGDQTHGYVILPADAFIRSLAGDKRPAPKVLFPQESLRQRLGSAARLRSADLLHIPGRPQRIEASFESGPRYEFDNVDEMLWWKHTRHLEGPALPTEGLCDLVVHLGADDGNGEDTLRLVRSRHRTLSFRFDPPSAWRTHMPTRDGKTYAFRVRRAVYETDSSA